MRLTGWARLLIRHPAGRVFLPLGVFLVLASASLVLWRIESWRRSQQLTEHANIIASRLAHFLTKSVDDHIWPLEGMATRSRMERYASEDAFGRVSRVSVQHVDDYDLVGWVDARDVCRDLSRASSGALSPGQDLSRSRRWATLLSRAESTRMPAAGERQVTDSGTIEIPLAFPVFSGSAPNSPYLGSVIGVLRFDHVIRSVLEGEWSGAGRIEIRDGTGTLFRHEPPNPAERVGESGFGVVRVLDRSFDLMIWPPPAQDGGGGMPLILFAGLAGSLLVAGFTFLTLHNRAVNVEHDRQHAQALESLNEITAVISGRLGGGQDLLDYLAVSARRLLRTEMASVLLYNSEQREFHVRATSGLPTIRQGDTFSGDEVPLAQQCLENGELIDVSDVVNEKRRHNSSLLRAHQVRSLLIIPLRVGITPVGVLATAETRKRRFSDRDRRLAQLLGSQVAVMLTNSRLYEQMSDALRAQQRLTLQREKLTAVTLAVYQAASLDESLKRMVELAPSALDMDLCVVGLISESGEDICAAAATPPFQGLVGQRFAVAGGYIEQVLRSRTMLVIENAPDNEMMDDALRQLVRIGALVYIPLFEGTGRPLGVIFLVRHTPGKVSEEQLRLSQVFASRTASAIEAAMLYQQTRRDAETKAMLLRELNHRVKNNLAGIVGLLSARPADLELPRGAQQWLDRVIERISIMGRAHELFLGGPHMVGLAELVDQLLPSLSIVKPTGVRVHKDLGDVRVKLSTERAVALAMVLHELCYNAIAHGLGERGTLTIRARNEQNDVIIEVIDDGMGPADSLARVTRHPLDRFDVNDRLPRPADRKGWGLRLVEGLVARELHGRFTVRRGGTEAGTVATVEFPLTGEGA